MPKFPKPGKKKKNRPKSKRIYIHDIEEPESKHCRNCKIETGTECYHHSESTRIKFLSGGGIMGGKINDKFSAWLCDHPECGLKFDTKPNKDCQQKIKDDHDLFSYDCIIQTWLV